MSSKLLTSSTLTRSPSIVGEKRPWFLVTYSRSTMVDMIEAYVEGRPMPSSSSSLTSVASLNRGGGSVKCRALPQVAEGQTLRLDKIRPDHHFVELRLLLCVMLGGMNFV